MTLGKERRFKNHDNDHSFVTSPHLAGGGLPSPVVADALTAIAYTVWALFVVENLVKLYLAPNRWQFVRTRSGDCTAENVALAYAVTSTKA